MMLRCVLKYLQISDGKALKDTGAQVQLLAQEMASVLAHDSAAHILCSVFESLHNQPSSPKVRLFLLLLLFLFVFLFARSYLTSTNSLPPSFSSSFFSFFLSFFLFFFFCCCCCCLQTKITPGYLVQLAKMAKLSPVHELQLGFHLLNSSSPDVIAAGREKKAKKRRRKKESTKGKQFFPIQLRLPLFFFFFIF